MKKINLFILLFTFPIILVAQKTDSLSKGIRAGIIITPTIIGEYGMAIEHYSGNHSLVLSLGYMSSVISNDADFDFNKRTAFYLPSKGPIFRLAYKFSSLNSSSRAGFYIMPELFFRQSGFDHVTFYRKSDKNPLEETYSLCGKHYGGAVKFGWQNYFGQRSKVFWELNIGVGAFYYVDHSMLYYSKYYVNDPDIEKLIETKGWRPTFSLNFIIGFDFSK